MSGWIDQIFEAKQINKDGTVRRKISTIEKYASKAAVVAECNRRGYKIIENGDQWIIFTNPTVKFVN